MQTSTAKQTFWTNHLRQWQASGLTQVAYCERENIKVHQLTYQKSKLDGKAKSARRPKVGTSKFASVAVLSSASTEALTITLPNGTQMSGIDSSNLSIAQQLLEHLI
jgi:hypothetical protein|tara:strand:+ start:83 stop:403 length:321 start_codon:yes stop_codon:yes gene_type:complete